MINTITHAEFPHGDLGGWGADRSAPPTDPPVCALSPPRINHVMNFISDSQEAQNGPVRAWEHLPGIDTRTWAGGPIVSWRSSDSPGSAGETEGLVTPRACDMTGCGSGSVRCHGIESVPSRACGDLGSVRSQQFGWVRMLPDPNLRADRA